MLAVLMLNVMATKRRKAMKKPTKPGKLETKSPEDYCRTCLSTSDLVSMFYNKQSEEKRSSELKLVTGLDIRMNDGLSQKICSNCILTINSALQFRRTSKKAEKALLNMITGTNKKKPKLKDAKPKVEKHDTEEYNYEYTLFGEEFQNDYDYAEPVEEKAVIKEKPVGRKRSIIPNASSYKCPTCSKEFRMKATYKAHMRFHTNYCVCEACGKRCRNNNQLQEHKRARHGLGRIHKCAYCEYSSATKEALTIHERRHTGERPYICDHCGATFHRRSNLVQHIAIHLPEKNFQCDMCPKKLKSRKFLQIHKHNAHTGKRYGYLCPVCARRFEKPNKVRAHAARVHGLPAGHHPPIVRVQL